MALLDRDAGRPPVTAPTHAPRHAPDRFGRWIADHQSTMQGFLKRAYFVLDENLALTDVGGGQVALGGTIECVNGIYVTVNETLRVTDGEGLNATVQSVRYSYNAVIGKLGTLLRYDSPHGTHHRAHHKHEYDVLAGDTEGMVILLGGEEDRPTLGEAIDEVEAWYYEHFDEVLRQTLDQ